MCVGVRVLVDLCGFRDGERECVLCGGRDKDGVFFFFRIFFSGSDAVTHVNVLGEQIIGRAVLARDVAIGGGCSEAAAEEETDEAGR